LRSTSTLPIHVGTIGINAGPCSGGVDTWFATITGKGGHGAHPDQTIDPFHLLAHVILGLNGIVSRRIDPFQPAVVSIGAVNGGFTENVIPDQVKLSGTARFTNEEVQLRIRQEMTRVFDVTRLMGGNYELKFQYGGPPMVNDDLVSEVIETTGRELLGVDNVHEIQKTMGAEDFSEFLNLAPGAMFTLGVQKKGTRGIQTASPQIRP
jgi:amidohydrolase